VENVGGAHLEAAIGAMRDRGRIAWVGAVSQYNDKQPPPGPSNLFEVVHKNLRLEGFMVRDHAHRQGELEAFLLPHIQSGRVGLDETIVDGFDNVVDAFLGVLAGKNVGKMIVRAARAA
jgi:NADPH-dependent curcumin reductase CurA